MASKDANEKLAAFFGKIPRDECTRVLTGSRRNGTYLIRYGAPALPNPSSTSLLSRFASLALVGSRGIGCERTVAG